MSASLPKPLPMMLSAQEALGLALRRRSASGGASGSDSRSADTRQELNSELH